MINPKVLEILNQALLVAEKSDKPQQDTICALVELVHFLADESFPVVASSRKRYKHIKSDMVQPPAELTLEKVMEIEAHGLSISKSAYLLNVNPATLCYFINSHRLDWRGKHPCYKRGETNPNSNKQRAIAAGLKYNTVIYRMLRKGISFDEALALGAAR